MAEAAEAETLEPGQLAIVTRDGIGFRVVSGKIRARFATLDDFKAWRLRRRPKVLFA
jgi:hypothetical protein